MADMSDPEVVQNSPVAPAKRSTPTWLIVLVVIGVAGIVVLFVGGVLAALAVYGTSRYLASAKTAEARMMLAYLAGGIGRCVQSQGSLPDSAGPVPASLEDIRGKKYMASPDDWEPFACTGVSMTSQYFQYQWVRSSPTTGQLIAMGDLNANGAPSRFTLRVQCASDTGPCKAGPSVEVEDEFE